MATNESRRRTVQISQEEYDRLTVGRDIYDEQLHERARRAPRRSSNPIPWLMVGLLCMFILMGVGLVLKRPDLIVGPAGGSAPAKVYPTLSTRQRDTYQQESGATAAEQQAIQQAAPPVPTAMPDETPVPQPPAPVVAPEQARQFSPVDLGWAPPPTPTTMLTQEQFDASQASEEQNQINTQLSGLTNAQQLVTVHEAEQNAQNP